MHAKLPQVLDFRILYLCYVRLAGPLCGRRPIVRKSSTPRDTLLGIMRSQASL